MAGLIVTDKKKRDPWVAPVNATFVTFSACVALAGCCAASRKRVLSTQVIHQPGHSWTLLTAALD